MAAQKAEEQEKKDARKERIRKNKENNSNEDDSAPIPVTPEVNLPIANVSATVNIPSVLYIGKHII